MSIEFKTQPKSISDIYYLANTPVYLYTMLRQDQYVILLSNIDSSILIDEFKLRASLDLKTIEEIAFMYSLLVALTFKPIIEVKEFMSYIQNNISFEWLCDIVNIYYSSQKSSTIINNFQIPPIIKTFSIHNEM